MQQENRFEPWPWALAISLFTMIGIAIGFWAIASANPDPVIDRSPKPGVTAGAPARR